MVLRAAGKSLRTTCTRTSLNPKQATCPTTSLNPKLETGKSLRTTSRTTMRTRRTRLGAKRAVAVRHQGRHGKGTQGKDRQATQREASSRRPRIDVSLCGFRLPLGFRFRSALANGSTWCVWQHLLHLSRLLHLLCLPAHLAPVAPVASVVSLLCQMPFVSDAHLCQMPCMSDAHLCQMPFVSDALCVRCASVPRNNPPDLLKGLVHVVYRTSVQEREE